MGRLLCRLIALLGLVLLVGVLWVAATIVLHSQKDDVERLITKHSYLEGIADLAPAGRPRPDMGHETSPVPPKNPFNSRSISHRSRWTGFRELT